MTMPLAWLAGGVDALGWTLVHFLWQGALVGVLTAVALAALRGARPQLRYAVACAGLLACVLWPAVTLALRLRIGGMAEGAVPAAQFTGLPHAAALGSHMEWIVAAWATCCIMLLARTALGMAWIAHATRTEGRDAHWQRQLDRLAQAMGVARQVRLRVVRHLASPVTAGCWRPVVLVPASLLSGMPPELLHALLAHELAHIRRHDYLVNLLQNLAESLLFYHPAVWWLSRRIRFERELIADDLAAAHAGGPRRLAHALSELEKRQFAHHEPALAADGGDLMKRITRLLRHESRPASASLSASRRDTATTLTAMLAAVLPALALAGAMAAGHAQAEGDAVVKPDQAGKIVFEGCAKPVWPAASLAAKESGTVTLAFLIGTDGSVDDARVRKSSGHPSLDQAALEGIGKCRFVPAHKDGAPVKAWMMMQYVWMPE
ncbi:M56 family metallopeptidase [Massilia sp. METH4]|uniref:M56 family metallopeptidase n=1 Tax=Massilia sp. METH4 TaxID=3123041 RepID=UPI0030CA9C40